MDEQIEGILLKLDDNKLSKELISSALAELENLVNHLIQTDFQKLVTILYRVDVNEEKLRSLLAEHQEEDAARIIARLIIERQFQKIESRKQYRSPDQDIRDEDRW